MKIVPLNFSIEKQYANRSNNESVNAIDSKQQFKLYQTKVPCYAKNIIPLYSSRVNFGSNSLETEFKNCGSSYLSMLKQTSANPKDLAVFLTAQLNGFSSRDKFIEELTEKPAESQKIVALLIEKLGGKKNFLQWYFGKSGYVYNYEKFLKDKFESAKDIDELLKYQPNWGYWALERKYCQMQGYTSKTLQDEMMRDRKSNFTLGELPEDFGSISYFRSLISRMKSAEWMFDGDLYNGSSYYKVKQLPGGDLSSKNIFEVRKYACDKKYIIKMDRFYPEDKLERYDDNPYVSRLAKETKLLRGDSVFLNACMDRYLELNGVKTNAKLLFYDFKNNASIYEFVDADEIKGKESLGMLDQIQANQIFSEMNKNGIFLNDIGMSFNCYRDKSGDLKLVDVGHAEYIDMLKPGGNLLTLETSNLSGFSLKNALSALDVTILSKLDGKFDNTSQVVPLGQQPQNAPDIRAVVPVATLPQKPEVIIPEVVDENDDAEYKGYQVAKKLDTSFQNTLPSVSAVEDAGEYFKALERNLYDGASDLNDFCLRKDRYKRYLKNAILTAEYNEPGKIAYKERLALLNFYRKNILARFNGYLDNDVDTIKGILEAMKREIKIMTKDGNLPQEYDSTIQGYKFFYAVCKRECNK